MDKRSIIGCVFSNDRQSVLLVKRRDVPVWTLPGGKVEDNETEEEGLIREIEEETGYACEIVRLVGLYFPINRLAKKTALYEMKILKGEKQLSSETTEVDFFSLDALPLDRLPIPYEEWILDAYQNHKEVLQKKLFSVNYKNFFKYLCSHPFLVLRFLLSRAGFAINS